MRRRGQPSLQRRLLTGMLLPAAAAAVVMGVGGIFLVHSVVETTHDRLLDGSVLAIAERLAVEDDEVTVDLPPVALGMLESQSQDSIYYSITYRGGLVTGYIDLPQPQGDSVRGPTALHWDATYRGREIRIAARWRRVYGLPEPVLVQVAETTNGRRELEMRMLGALTILEAALLGLVGALTWWSVNHALAPLARLGRAIAGRALPGATSVEPLDTSAVPVETLAPVLAFNALLDRLERSFLTLRRFTGDASHQLRTPIAVLRLNLDLLQRQTDNRPGLASSRPETLRELDTAVQRMERLTAQLLSLAFADDEGVGSGISLAPLDLTEVVADVLTHRAPQVFDAGHDLAFLAPSEPAHVIGDALLVREMLCNLLDNAIRYTPPNGSIVVRISLAGDAAILRVEDTGPGIPTAERTRVFERFYRGAEAHASEGSGLGLSIVRAMADRLGAKVDLASVTADGKGLIAAVTFRTVRAATPALTTAEARYPEFRS